MSGEISLLAAIIWAVVSGLIGVGIGFCVCALLSMGRERCSEGPSRAADALARNTTWMSDHAKKGKIRGRA